MSPRTFVTRAAAVLALAALGLAACESKTIVQPSEQPLAISVSPTSITLTSVGATAQVVALVTGGPTGTAHTVTWASSNTNVATVDANGNVTAKAAGTTSIVATATADATVKAAAQVLVQLSAPTDTVPPTVSIKSIVENDGSAVDLQHVYGSINVVLNVDVPAGNAVTAVNWLIDGQNVCSQTFTGSASNGAQTAAATAAVEMSCQINTADTTAAGLPKFLNGQHTVSATLVSGTTIKATTSQILIFQNDDELNFTQSFTSHAVDPDGLGWQGGNMTLSARPIMYSGGSVAKVTFQFYGCFQWTGEYTAGRAKLLSGAKPGPAARQPTIKGTKVSCDYGASQAVTDSVAPFMVTFAADTTIALPAGSEFSGHEQPLEGALAAYLYGYAFSVTAAGTEGPSAEGPSVQYDNRPPYFTSDAMAPEGGWLGLVTLKASTFEAEATDEGGVSGPASESGLSSVIYQVQARDTGAETWTTYASTSAIGNKLFATEEFRVKACDALNNCNYSDVSPALGVDIQPPTVQFDVANTVKDGDKFNTNPTTAAYVIGFTDLPTPGGSGFSTTTPVQVIEKADTGGGFVCVDGSETTDPCDTPAMHDSNVPVDGAGTQQGYVTMSAYVVDQAQNKSNTITRTVLVDYTAPTADSLTVPTAPLAGGAAETFRAVFKDNVVLASSTGQLSYVGAAFVKNIGSVTLGAYGQFVKRATGDFADPFFIAAYRTLGSATWVLPENLAGTVKDVAGDSTVFALAVPDVPDAPTTDPFERVTAATIAVASDSVSLTATLTIGTDSVTVPPNAQVQVYKFASAMHSLVATATAPIITVNTTLHTATFTWTATASSKVGTGQLSAMFVTTNGIALFVPGS